MWNMTSQYRLSRSFATLIIKSEDWSDADRHNMMVAEALAPNMQPVICNNHADLIKTRDRGQLCCWVGGIGIFQAIIFISA